MQEVQERGDGANSAGWSDGLHRLVQVQAINSAIAGDGGLELTQDWSDNELAADLNLHRKRIDYVFVSDQFMRAGDAGRVLHAEVVCDRPLTGVAASDHRGVLVDIAWPDRAEIGNQ
jgi:endonuclease/exonuclease/phosphatase family metal-dependent hydrolase